MRISDWSSDVCSSDLAATTSALDFRQRPPGQTADIHGGRLDDSGVAIFIGGHIGRDRVGFAIIAVAFRHLQSCEIGQYRVGTEASRDPGQKTRAPARDSDRFRMPRGGEAGRPETGMPRLRPDKPPEDDPNTRAAPRHGAATPK